MWHPGAVAAREPDRLAAAFPAATMTYGALDAASRACAARLFAAGLGPRDTVLLLVGQTPGFLAAAWAAQRSGLTYLPASTRLAPPELAYLLADSGAKALIVADTAAALADAALARLPHPVVRLDLDEALAPTNAPDAPALEGGDLLYTSGTTGRPKGVKRPLKLEPLGSDDRRVARGRALFGLDGSSVFLSPAPLYHAAPLRFAMNLLRVGGTVVGLDRFDAEAALAAIDARRVTHSQWVPTMFRRLLLLPPETRARYDLSSHRVAIHAGAPCPEPFKRAMIDWWGPILHEYYSGTESIGFTHATSAEWLARPGTVGRPWGCRVHILDEAGRELPPGATGRVFFAGGAPVAYHKAAGKTAGITSPEGWQTMGDIGHVDADGYLFLTDRAAFTVISGGVNIYPGEVEAALLALPALVFDCAVFGVPDPDLGERVQALVVPPPGVAAGAALAEQIFRALDGSLSPVKQPRHIAFLDDLVRTETGKLAKAALKAEWAGRQDQGFARPSRKAA